MRDAAGVTYFNPQLGPGEWTEAHEARELQAKEAADVLLFVVGESTRGVASIAEVAYFLGARRPIALYVADVPEGARFEGQVVGERERADLNRGRFFLRTMAAAHGVPVHATVAAAVDHAVQLAKAARPTP